MSACTGTVVTVNKRESLGRFPVWQHTITYAVVSGDTTATITLPINGILQKIIYKRPNTTNDNLTSQLTIADEGDNTIFSGAATEAENATSTYNLSEPLVGDCDVLATFNEDVGVTATFTVTLRGV